jgi:hypothetical protein
MKSCLIFLALASVLGWGQERGRVCWELVRHNTEPKHCGYPIPLSDANTFSRWNNHEYAGIIRSWVEVVDHVDNLPILTRHVHLPTIRPRLRYPDGHAHLSR